jgi:vacuolar-type H+-ATPase subunit I/STV1
MMRMVVARLLVAMLLGIVVGYAVGKSTEADAERGNALTMKEYIADFDHHKQELISSRLPMAAAIIVGTLMVVAMFGLYEVLAWGMDRLLAMIDRRRNVAVQPGTPPPW